MDTTTHTTQNATLTANPKPTWTVDTPNEQMDLISGAEVKLGQNIIIDQREFEVVGKSTTNLPSGVAMHLSLRFTGVGKNSAGIEGLSLASTETPCLVVFVGRSAVVPPVSPPNPRCSTYIPGTLNRCTNPARFWLTSGWGGDIWRSSGPVCEVHAMEIVEEYSEKMGWEIGLANVRCYEEGG